MGGVQRGFVRAKGPGGSHLTVDRLWASLAVHVGDEYGSDGCRRWRWPRGGFGAHYLEHRVEVRALHICQVRRGLGEAGKSVSERGGITRSSARALTGEHGSVAHSSTLVRRLTL